MHPAGALDDWGGEQSGFAQEFEGEAGPYDIYDGINGSNFVEMDFFGRLAVNLALRHGNALEHRHRFLFDPFGEGAVEDELLYFRKSARVRVCVTVIMGMLVFVFMLMLVFVGMAMAGFMSMFVMVVVFQMNIEFDAFYARPALAGNMQMIFLKPQFFQLLFELMKINAEVEQRAEKHVAADAAEDIEVNSFH